MKKNRPLNENIDLTIRPNDGSDKQIGNLNMPKITQKNLDTARAKIKELLEAVGAQKTRIDDLQKHARIERDGFDRFGPSVNAQMLADLSRLGVLPEKQAEFDQFSREVINPEKQTLIDLERQLAAAREKFAAVKNQFESENLPQVTEAARQALDEARKTKALLQSKISAIQADISSTATQIALKRHESGLLIAEQAAKLVSGESIDAASQTRIQTEITELESMQAVRKKALVSLNAEAKAAGDLEMTKELELKRLIRLDHMRQAAAAVAEFATVCSAIPKSIVIDSLRNAGFKADY